MQPIKSEQSKIQTLYKNEILWAVNKPSQTHFDEFMPHSVIEGWQLAHRLDFETSGIILLSKNQYLDEVSSLFKDPSSGIKKIYIAGVSSEPITPPPSQIDGYIGSRYRRSKSVKFYDTKKIFRGWHSVRPAKMAIDANSKIDSIASELDFNGLALEVELQTGVRHQIRATLSFLDAPIVGDPLYNEQASKKPMELHAYKMVIPKSSLSLLNEDLEIICNKQFKPEAQE